MNSEEVLSALLPLPVGAYPFELCKCLRYLLLWTSLYVAIHLLTRFSKDTNIDLDIKNRLISIVHGLAAFLLCLAYICVFGFNFELPKDFWNLSLIALSFAYFTYDLVACLMFGLWDAKLIIHHLFCLSGCSFIIWYGQGMFACIVGLVMAESSNFPMHTRSVLKNLGLRHTRLYFVMDVTYMAIYIIFRGMGGPVFCVMAFMSPSTPIVVAFVFMLILAQSIYFIRVMLKILRKNRLQYKERKAKGVSLFWFSINPKILQMDYVLNKKKKKKDKNVF